VVRLASSEEIVEPVARPEPVKKRETKKRDDDDNKHDVPPIF
jgi:hypothetical protein